ncbi:MAG: hypothetical protein FWB78_11410 [Treponema sp.]|nr:hypothetical protein [Treponema sp.]
MKSGFDTGYFAKNGEIFKSGISTDLSIGYDGRIKKGGADTGYFVSSAGGVRFRPPRRRTQWARLRDLSVRAAAEAGALPPNSFAPRPGTGSSPRTDSSMSGFGLFGLRRRGIMNFADIFY